MAVHEHFEQLCALATIGELTEQELQELQDHLQGCTACQAALGEFDEVYTVLADAADTAADLRMPEDASERFILRARSAGIALNSLPIRRSKGSVLRWPIRYGHVLGTAVAMLIVGLGLFVAGMRFQSTRSSPTNTPVPNSHQEIARSQESTRAAENDSGLREQLRKLQRQIQSVSSQLETKKQALASAKAETDSLASRLRDLQATNSTLQENEGRTKTELAQLRQDLAQARSRQTDAEAALLADEETIATLRGQLKSSQDLLAGLNEAHDLIVDRNVHVLNVFPEVNENAKSVQPRGRIFYAEGKKLVFYAYDLTDPGKISTQASFYLWGEAPAVRQLVSLGKFQIDSAKQGRWVLRVTDPKLLAHVNSVFVTLEPNKQAVTKPTGKRMLSRLLASKTDNQ